MEVTKHIRGKIAVSRDTLSRWLREVMQEAGIVVNKYCAHSTRSAAVSSAKSKNVPIDIILQTAGCLLQAIWQSFITNLLKSHQILQN